MSQQPLFWASTLSTWKHLFTKKYALLCSLQHYSWWPRHGGNQCPSVEDWIKKMGSIYTMGSYSAIREDEILPFATMWMDLENIIPSDSNMQTSIGSTKCGNINPLTYKGPFSQKKSKKWHWQKNKGKWEFGERQVKLVTVQNAFCSVCRHLTQSSEPFKWWLILQVRTSFFLWGIVFLSWFSHFKVSVKKFPMGFWWQNI